MVNAKSPTYVPEVVQKLQGLFFKIPQNCPHSASIQANGSFSIDFNEERGRQLATSLKSSRMQGRVAPWRLNGL